MAFAELRRVRIFRDNGGRSEVPVSSRRENCSAPPITVPNLKLEDLRMTVERPHLITTFLMLCGLGGLPAIAVAADAPTPEMALRLTPVQPFVDYEKPTPEEA